MMGVQYEQRDRMRSGTKICPGKIYVTSATFKFYIQNMFSKQNE